MKLQSQAGSQYGLPQPLSNPTISPVIANRPPNSKDTGHSLGRMWIDKSTSPANSWYLIGVLRGVANWQQVTNSGTLNLFQLANGDIIKPSGNRINFLANYPYISDGDTHTIFLTNLENYIDMITTTDGSETVLLQYDLTPETSWFFYGTVSVFNQNTNDMSTFSTNVLGSFFSTGVIVGQVVTNIANTGSLSGINLNWSVVGAKVFLTAKGLATTNLDWQVIGTGVRTQ